MHLFFGCKTFKKFLCVELLTVEDQGEREMKRNKIIPNYKQKKNNTKIIIIIKETIQENEERKEINNSNHQK